MMILQVLYPDLFCCAGYLFYSSKQEGGEGLYLFQALEQVYGWISSLMS
jgi:hypothetical protein